MTIGELYDRLESLRRDEQYLATSRKEYAEFVGKARDAEIMRNNIEYAREHIAEERKVVVK